jgi:hypothetical protein
VYKFSRPVKFSVLLFLGLLLNFNSYSQESSDSKRKVKGTVYLVWGYNRDWYTHSTLHFKGSNPNGDYKFDVKDARAHDQPDMQHILHRPLTVPQYNLNFGYFFNDKHDLGIEGSWNHLKYVMYNNEVRHVSGQIYGNSINQDTLVGIDFVRFEHTNGNNYAMISLVKRMTLFKTKKDFLRINALFKYGVGGLVPKTDSRLFNYHNDGPFRLSGFVTGVNVGLRVDLFKYFFLDTNFQGAFADYTSGIIYNGRVHHHFFSLQYIWAAGINIPLSGKN